MKPDFQIYSAKGSKAFFYVLDFVFYTFYKCSFEWIESLSDRREESILINYSNKTVPHAIQIVPNKYLFQSNLLEHPSVKSSLWDELPVFFKTDGDVPFDIFAAIFYLLARVEEYNQVRRDKHGRFSSENSVFDLDFIQRPIIDEWLIKLKSNFFLNRGVSFPEREFKWINTYDIDVAYAYKSRSLKRIIGAACRNIFRREFDLFMERIRVLMGNEPDPYDTYQLQQSAATSTRSRTIYFFLLGDKSPHDRNLSHKNEGMIRLIQHVSRYAEVGIHPSYISGEQPERIEVEKKRLAAIANEPITKSRQHFLRFWLPETYQNLIEAGIEEEYSMGYADLPGFRAGTCTPYYFFDLNRNYASTLKIFPLIVMDGTLRDYLNLTPAEGLEIIKTMIDRVKSVNGVFVSLWHNDVLRENSSDDWRAVYIAMVDYIKEQ